MNYLPLLMLLGAGSFLEGCIPRFVAPSSGEQAVIIAKRINYFGDTQPESLFIFDDEQCANQRQAIPDDEGAIVVPAGRPVFIGDRFINVGGIVSIDCKVRSTFTPVPGATYEVDFRIDSSNGTCTLPVFRLLASGQKQSEPTWRYFDHKKCHSFPDGG
jgi:hypothetical protein